MNVFALSERANHSDQLLRVLLHWPTPLVFESVRNPTTVENQSSSLNGDWILTLDYLTHGHLTTFVTVEWVDNIVACLFLSIDVLVSRDENFF